MVHRTTQSRFTVTSWKYVPEMSVIRGPKRRVSKLDSPALFAVYVPGVSPVHRAPVLGKLITLLVSTIVVSSVRNPSLACVFLAAACGAFLLARLPWATVWAIIYVLPALVAITAFHLFTGRIDLAIAVPLSLLGCVILATVVTATTKLNEILSVLTSALSRVCKPHTATQISLGVSLMIRSLPMLLGTADESRVALRSRGIKPTVTTFLIPFFIRATGDALDLGDALHVRGILDSGDEKS